MFENLKLSDLPERNCGTLRTPSPTRPNIWIVEECGKRAVVKDFSSKGFFYKHIVGRILVWRESKAYKYLEGIAGIPSFYGTLDGIAIIIEEVPGQNLLDFEKGIISIQNEGASPEKVEEKKKILTQNFFDALEKLVGDFHERGIVHCDLKRTPNILLGKDGRPYIIDWASYTSKKKCSFWPLTLLYKRFFQDDCLAVTKLKVNNRPDLATEEEHQAYRDYKAGREEAGLERTIRGLRKKFRDLLKKMA